MGGHGMLARPLAGDGMARQLILANAVLSLRGRVHIRDGAQQPRYEARGEFALVSPTWRLWRGEHQVGTVRRLVWRLRPHWVLELHRQRFAVVGKLLSWRRHYRVQGGRFDGATVTGSLIDRSFVIEHNGTVLADAKVRWLSLVDAQQVQVHADDDHCEDFVALAMLLVQLARNSERRRSA